jgi:hypothetical protein
MSENAVFKPNDPNRGVNPVKVTPPRVRLGMLALKLTPSDVGLVESVMLTCGDSPDTDVPPIINSNETTSYTAVVVGLLGSGQQPSLVVIRIGATDGS